MNDLNFIRIAKDAFGPFLKEQGFVMGKPSINGREYCVSFTSKSHSVQIAFEPGDSVFFTFIFRLEERRCQILMTPWQLLV